MTTGTPGLLRPQRTPSKEFIDSLCTPEFIASINGAVAAHRTENAEGGMNLNAVIKDLIATEPFLRLLGDQGVDESNPIDRGERLYLTARFAYQIAARLREKKLDHETSFSGQLFDIPARVELMQKAMVSKDPAQPPVFAPRYVARLHPEDMPGGAYPQLNDAQKIIAAQINFAVPLNPDDSTQGYKAGFQLKLAVPHAAEARHALQMTVQAGGVAHCDTELNPLIAIILMAQFSQAFESHAGAGILRRYGEVRRPLKELIQSLPPLPRVAE